MIGDLINRFENMATNTVADFNEVFKDTPLYYPEHFEVEIGNVFNATRMITINGNEQIFLDLTPNGMTSDYFKIRHKEVKKVVVFYADKTLVGVFNSKLDASRFIGIGYTSFYSYVRQGKLIVEVLNG